MRVLWNTPNRRLWRGVFVSAAGGRDASSGRFFWPAVWLEARRRPSWDIELWRVGLAWWSFRMRVTVGVRHPIPSRPDMVRDGLSQLPMPEGKGVLSREQIIKGMERDPALHPLVMMGLAHSHYGRLLLSREWSQDKAETPQGIFSQLSDPRPVGTHPDAGPTGR